MIKLTSQRAFSSGCGIVQLETISYEPCLKFNPELIYHIQLPVTSIKPFCPSAMTMSGRQKKTHVAAWKGRGTAVWRAAGACRQNSNGIAFRLLEKALCIHSAGFQLQTLQGGICYRMNKCSPKKRSVDIFQTTGPW